MPLYEYQCPHCGRFETIRKFSDPLLTKCPTCGREVEKLASAPAIQFKGTGWYVTDYARKSSGGDAASKAEVKESKEGKGGGKSDGKAKGGEGASKGDSAAAATVTTAKDGTTSGGSSTKS